MSIALTEAMQQAQHSFEGGNYRAVVESCNRIVAQFPSFASAYALLAQAHLEQGQQAEAEQAFARVIAHDPRAAGAYLGLGLIAEERGVLENALAYCQVAWELVPNRDHFRSPVVRVAGLRYGADGRLQLTHAALAQLHVNASRLRRAVHEYQTALTELPDRIDLWLGLAETLWRLGQDADASEISREFLKDHPDLVQALVILTDIEHRAGNDPEAEQLRERLRRVDPDGQVTRIMVDLNPLADRDYLLVSDAEVPVLDERVDVVVTERPQIAPAPDFSYQPSRGDEPEVDFEDLQPMAPEEFAGDLQGEPSARPPEPQITQQLPQLPSDDEAEPEAEDLGDLAAAFAGAGEVDVQTPQAEPVAEMDLEDLAAEFDDLRPMDFDEFGIDAEAPTETGLAAIDGLMEDDAGESNLDDLIAQFDDTESIQSAIADGDMADILAEFEGIEPISPDEFGATEEELAQAEGGFFSDAEIDFDMRIDDPAAVRIGQGGPPPVAQDVDEPVLEADDLSDAAEPVEPEMMEAEPFETHEFEAAPEDTALEDDVVDEFFTDVDEDPVVAEFTAGDDVQPETVAEELLAGEDIAEQAPVADDLPREDFPEVPSGTGFTRLLGELGEEGLAPFDPADAGGETHDYVMDQDSAGDDEPSDFARLTEGWDEADQEIESAIPTDTASTDELRALEELGLTPFEVEEAGGTDQLTAFSPFGAIAPSPATEADEIVDEQPDEVDDTPVVTNEAPETRVLEEPVEAEPAAAGEPEVFEAEVAETQVLEVVPEVEAAPEPESVTEEEEDFLAGIEPFAIEDFDEIAVEEDPFSFGSLPWETSASESALPSDEDLDRMLASEAAGLLEETADNDATILFDEESLELPDEDIPVSLKPEQPEQTIPFNAFELEPEIPEYDFGDQITGIDASMAVTRELGQPPSDVDLGADFEQRMSEVESAAAENLQHMHEEPASVAEEAFFGAPTAPIRHEQATEQPEQSQPTLSPTDLFTRTDAEKLVADARLFDRTREVKTELIAEGVIRGDRELVEERVAEAPAPVVEAPAVEEQPEEPRFEIKTGATKDISTLRASLRAAPHDDELHWWLAEALREAGEAGDAMTEYRWLIRNAPHRQDDVIAALIACTEQDQEAEVAHRLLADLYRRRGDSGQARNHATLALAVRRSQR